MTLFFFNKNQAYFHPRVNLGKIKDIEKNITNSFIWVLSRPDS